MSHCRAPVDAAVDGVDGLDTSFANAGQAVFVERRLRIPGLEICRLKPGGTNFASGFDAWTWPPSAATFLRARHPVCSCRPSVRWGRYLLCGELVVAW